MMFLKSKNTSKTITTLKFKRFIYLFFSVLYFIILIYIVFFTKRRYTKINYRCKFNLIPFKQKYSTIQQLNLQNIHIQKDFLINLTGNILMFIPFFFAINTLFNKEFSNRKIISLTIISTLSIELFQFIFNIGVADIDDVILNITGGVIGILLNKIKFLNKAL